MGTIVLEKFKYKVSLTVVALVVVSVLGLVWPVSAVGPTTVNLLTADNFAILGGSGITNTGASTITGDVGSYPTTTQTGFSGANTVTITGTNHFGDATTQGAKTDLDTAYADAATRALPSVTTITSDLGTFLGGTLTPGIYRSGSSIGLTGTVTLDGGGDPNAVFIFQAPSSTLTTASNSVVNLTNGAQACNVFWQVGSSATLGTTSNFKGNILAFSSITDDGGSTITGRLLARGALITLNNTTVTKATCETTHLIVIKHVINDSGGTGVAADFSTTITGVTTVTPTAAGVESPGVDNVLTSIGSYSVDEGAHVGYTKSLSAGCSGTIAVGETKTCTITNDDIAPVPATLHVIKTVINDNSGTAAASDFSMHVKLAGTDVAGSPAAGIASPGTSYTLDAGTYVVSEDANASYTQTFSGDCDSSGSVTLTAGQDKTCTITNDDIAPQLIVNKVVVNDNGGTKVISDFLLFIDGGSVTSGVASTTTIGLHTVSEIADSGYATTIGGNCAADGTITLALGDVKTCTVTNDDIAPVVPPSSGGGGSYYGPVPPLIDVLKVPSPLALPDGPGTVKYTYTLRNVGAVPVSDVTMVGDTCSPIALISGDVNADAILNVSETWVYTCSTALTKTHTNIVTVTGWANGVSATDIANATVIVGIPVVPPLIHVTKVPSPLVLSLGGGVVTYTNKVTNPGTVALSNVSLTDDKCSAVKYISGDTNGDSKLDITETWTYTCSANLTKTTVNTVTASGDANGLTARDFAIATIVVAASAPAPTPAPQLPSTGVAPDEKGIPWNIVMLAGIFVISIFYLVRRKQAI